MCKSKTGSQTWGLGGGGMIIWEPDENFEGTPGLMLNHNHLSTSYDLHHRRTCLPHKTQKTVWLSIPVFSGEHIAYQLSETCCMNSWWNLDAWYVLFLYCIHSDLFDWEFSCVPWQHTQSFCVVWGLYSWFTMYHLKTTWQRLVQMYVTNMCDYTEPWQTVVQCHARVLWRSSISVASILFDVQAIPTSHLSRFVSFVCGCCFEGEGWQPMGLRDYCWCKRVPAAIWCVLSVVCKVNDVHFCPSNKIMTNRSWAR